jgi:hypothetical protein
MSQAAHTRRGDGRRFGDPEKKGGLYVIRIRSKGEVKVPPHCHMTPPGRPKANAPTAPSPLLGIKI